MKDKYQTWVEFKFLTQDERLKRFTKIWEVLSLAKFRVLLGAVKWNSTWRKYCFFPNEYCSGLVFDDSCLRDIAKFCEEQTRLQRKEWRDARKAKS